MDKQKKIILVAGARPNFMKIAPIVRALETRGDIFTWELVHTGQHYDHEMSDVFFNELGIPKPHYHLDAGGGTHAEQTAKIMVGFEKVCVGNSPDIVIVVGDVNSTLACSIVAKKLQIKVAHVEAGLRSGDRSMPEEINRLVTDSISDLFFVTEESGLEHLLREGHKKESIHFVGHVMIDNLFYQVAKLGSMQTTFATEKFKKTSDLYGVVTLHRPSNVDSEERLSEILSALDEISQTIPLIFAVHPRTSQSLKKFGLSIPENIAVTPPLGYMEFLNLWKDAAVILTDSGGVQEESTALGIPCITLRENTERPVTITHGTNVLVGSSKPRILDAFRAAMTSPRDMESKRPALWDGRAAERILNILRIDGVV